MSDLPTFDELGLISPLLSAVKQLGFEHPSQIQAQTIPVALAGHDVVGLSETGSGKTAAFVLPALQQIDLTDKRPQVLILCPTRELSVQVCEEVNRLGSDLKKMSAVPVYGGAPIDRQIRALKAGTHLVVGTPGRLIDHLRRKTLHLEAVKVAILDEADRMLDMGFRQEIEDVFGAIPVDRQTLFFSATMNREVKRLIEHYGNAPRQIAIQRKGGLTVESIEQRYYEVRNRSKVEVIARCLDIEQPRLAIVFCNTKTRVDECTEALLARGFAADKIHGDITQSNRERVLKRFRAGKVEILVATDVAARGLDIDEVDVVFNLELPHDPEDYVHRIGRTGRAGRSGQAVSFIYGRDIYRLQTIERYVKQPIRRAKIPTQEEVQGQQANKIFTALKDRLENKTFTAHESFIDRLLDLGHTPTDIAGALFTMLREKDGRDGDTIQEDNESYVERRPADIGKGGEPKGRKGKFNQKRSRGNFKRRDSGEHAPRKGKKHKSPRRKTVAGAKKGKKND